MVGAPAVILPRRTAQHDLVIRGGSVIDGTGAPAVEMDVAVSGGRIAAVARRVADKGTIEIDARGVAVAPGFIDIHSHGDGSLFSDPREESTIRQGVTTIVVGQDGSSRSHRAAATTKAGTVRTPLWQPRSIACPAP
jgi:N-acyl-D-aspartate/D-glutamate deacylase